MTADIVNLNKFRKAKERAEKEKQARENRASFGRSKAERAQDAEEAQRGRTLLDQARRDLDENEPDGSAHTTEPSTDRANPDLGPGTKS